MELFYAINDQIKDKIVQIWQLFGKMDKSCSFLQSLSCKLGRTMISGLFQLAASFVIYRWVFLGYNYKSLLRPSWLWLSAKKSKVPSWHTHFLVQNVFAINSVTRIRKKKKAAKSAMQIIIKKQLNMTSRMEQQK